MKSEVKANLILIKSGHIFLETELDPLKFEFKGINTAKYFYDRWTTDDTLDSFDSSVMQSRKAHAFLARPLLVLSGFLRLLWFLATSRHKVVFFGAENRVTETSRGVLDLYNHNIIRDLGPENVLLLQERHDRISRKQYAPDLVLDDLAPFFFFLEKVLGWIHKNEINAFVAGLSSVTEKAGIPKQKTARYLLKFYVRYRFYKCFLKKIKPASAILVCHYARHAFVAACKHLGITNVELQHGHILPIHPHYNISRLGASMRGCFKQAFIPDAIAVYGDYWKQVLVDGMSFEEQQVINTGYFLTLGDPLPRDDRVTTLLLTSSPQVQQDVIAYIRSVKPQLGQKNMRIIIKPHPSEREGAYQEVLDGDRIRVDHSPVHQLFSQAHIHISVLSSTLFDALVYDVANYVLFVKRYSSFCQEFLDTKVAQRLDMGQLPDLEKKTPIDRKFFMDTYDFNRLRPFIERHS